MELGLNYGIQYSNQQGQLKSSKNLLNYFIELKCNKYYDISNRFNFKENIKIEYFEN